MKSGFILAVALGVLAAPDSAFAYQAFVTTGASLQAGPGDDYPPVADISGGEPVELYGCIGGYAWCDIAFRGYRGWFSGRLLTYPYEGQRMPLLGFGGQAGVPVVEFSLEDYWGRFYRDRPFYRDRAHWAGAPGAARVHGPVREHGDPGPHLPPTPQLQPHPPSHRDERPEAQSQ
jgi:uncharacterized protein YraI